ncbi:PPFIBP1 [Branchiostoma lanceolatum]|uniref:PPFIBP1 protein n=1 Tax=Branchiostoma lanceolatum TaxID=7740 RepID=A0A8K0EM33_BRALA|nr:PPFIBP1 [Branchiostoma lanceolatum]
MTTNIASTNMTTDASEMLAAALEQMDGIIAGSKTEFFNGVIEPRSPQYNVEPSNEVLTLLDGAKSLLETMEENDQDTVMSQLPEGTRNYLTQWLRPNNSETKTNGHAYPSDGYEEKIGKLENDKESLILQVSVLTDQVEAQGEKIRELENGIENQKDQQADTEEMLQQEILARSSLETQKLDLMADVSNLKIQMASLDKERADLEDKNQTAQSLLNEIAELKNKLDASEEKCAEFEQKNKQTQMEVATLQSTLNERDSEVEELKAEMTELKRQKEEEREKEEEKKTEDEGDSEKEEEYSNLKRAVESLMQANEEKDVKIEELKSSLNRYKRVQDMVLSASSPDEAPGEEMEPMVTPPTPPEQEPLEETLKETQQEPTPKPAMPDPAFTSTPISTNTGGDQLNIQELDTSHEGQAPSTINETPQTTVEAIEAEQVEKEPVMESPPKPPRLRPQARSSSLEEIKIISDSDKSPPPQSKFNTLPPKQKQPAQQQEPGLITRKGRGLGSFGKGFLKMRGGNKSTSAPNLSQTEAGSDSELDGISAHRAQPIKMEGDERFGYEPKKRGNTIKRFFGRLKRSASTTFNPDRDVEYEEPSPFRRGGRYRATAGPRLGWSRDLKPTTDLDTPFAKWDPDQVCQWLHEQGLGMYVANARHYVKRGETLLRSSPHDLERELGIKNYLHRKKLQLALQAIGSEDTSKMGELDHNWVTRWLDDVGLPQYKDPFNEARIDGRMLNYMTVDDLFKLNVTNVLHHLSFKRAIQVLRLQNFEPNCLRRRPTEETWQNGAEVMLWTNHRVMEWLRCVDLSEYAPNLRGSGVHGGLMVLEAKFNAETLAHLLSIPPNKTLLRRHLSTHFTQLVGAEIQRYKREHQEGPGYIPIKATDKMKPRKRSFSFTRKSRGQSHDYVCPMDCDFPVELSPGRGQPGFRGEVRAANLQHRQEPVRDDLDQEVPEVRIDEQAVQQIGAFSAEINTLTNMLSDDNFSPSSGNSDA